MRYLQPANNELIKKVIYNGKGLSSYRKKENVNVIKKKAARWINLQTLIRREKDENNIKRWFCKRIRTENECV